MTTKLEMLYKVLATTEYNLSEWARWDPEEDRELLLKQIEELKQSIILEERK